jgi:hypothetical protein
VFRSAFGRHCLSWQQSAFPSQVSSYDDPDLAWGGPVGAVYPFLECGALGAQDVHLAAVAHVVILAAGR